MNRTRIKHILRTVVRVWTKYCCDAHRLRHKRACLLAEGNTSVADRDHVTNVRVGGSAVLVVDAHGVRAREVRRPLPRPLDDLNLPSKEMETKQNREKETHDGA